MAGEEPGTFIGVTIQPPLPDAAKIGKKFVITGTRPDRAEQVPSGGSKQTGV